MSTATERPVRRHTFSAAERLKRRRPIEALFQSGKALSHFPLRLVWLLVERPAGEAVRVQAGVSVSKKKFKRAHDRNRIKRLMREVWRKSKALVYDAVPAGKALHLFWIFSGAELPAYPVVEEAMTKAIGRLVGALQKEAA